MCDLRVAEPNPYFLTKIVATPVAQFETERKLRTSKGDIPK